VKQRELIFWGVLCLTGIAFGGELELRCLSEGFLVSGDGVSGSKWVECNDTFEVDAGTCPAMSCEVNYSRMYDLLLQFNNTPALCVDGNGSLSEADRAFFLSSLVSHRDELTNWQNNNLVVPLRVDIKAVGDLYRVDHEKEVSLELVKANLSSVSSQLESEKTKSGLLNEALSQSKRESSDKFWIIVLLIAVCCIPYIPNARAVLKNFGGN
jgi:hypothetical protein